MATVSGLRCSHGSDLDTRIPRPKMPKRALPDSVRRKIKGSKENCAPSSEHDNDVYKAGAGVLAPVGSAADGSFLKRGSGVPASVRASALAQRRGDAAGARATIRRAALVGEGGAKVLPLQPGMRQSDRERRAVAATEARERGIVADTPEFDDMKVHKQKSRRRSEKRNEKGRRSSRSKQELSNNDSLKLPPLNSSQRNNIQEPSARRQSWEDRY
mmetsp:Transcript_28579/g.51794  ORF Transcript_28579/g.51794 Transcript_28579/m.51794 type:complete len:215 (-) Transcript_28579:212-856(-)